MLLGLPTHRVHYDLIGPAGGDVVCFAHALLADGGMWAEQATALAHHGYRVLRIDMRGHGGSDAPDGPCSIADLAADAVAVLDHLDLERVHFVGLSIGGVIGQSIAITHGARLSSLVLSDTNPASAATAKTMWSERIAAVRAAGSTAQMAAGMMGRLLSDGFKTRDPVRWRAIEATLAATRPEGVYACAQALQDFDHRDALAGLSVRTLVLCGEHDPATPPSEAETIAGLIPGARLQIIPDALHFPNVEHPDLYSTILLDWVSGR